MKSYMKKLLALVLVCTMIIPMGLISSFALEADEGVTANWDTLASKYSMGTWKIVAPKSGGYAIKTEGFTFNETDEGGIKIVTPNYETFGATYGVSAVTSKAATPLEGLSVVITPDEYDSLVDTNDGANSLNILWTEEKIEAIAGFNEASKSYDKGLYNAVAAYSNGLRHLIPVVEGATALTPASKVPDQANGKALLVRVTCDKQIGDDAAPVATSVSIVYYDGYYINDDGHPGYRWTFTARNHEDTQLADTVPVSTGYEGIDLRNGLAVNVRADEELGFIVNINGYDYYKGEEVAFFPDCDTNWVGYKTSELKEEQIRNEDPIWTSSMTYARADIDLSGLKAAGNGYVTVGAVSNNDKNLPDHHCNYTVDTINGVPAADWAGETIAEHECSYELVTTIGATCTRDGYDYYRCTVCGVAKNENIVTAFGHTPKEDITIIEKPTCSTSGTAARVCFVCRTRLEMTVAEPLAHTFETDWTGDFTCENGGTRTNTCTVCNTVVTETLPAGHAYEWVVTTAPTCGAEGVETETCTVCGATGETRPVPADSTAHTIGDMTPVIETIDGATDWFGKVEGTCTVCGEAAEDTVEVYDYVEHFTDVKTNHWFMSEVAYCVKQGYVKGMTETTFAPNKNLTRAEFLTLLAAVDGVDLTQYEGKDAGFEDVKPAHWWNKVICWAVENDITSGISPTKFGPKNNITRSQLARFFYVYTEKKGLDVSKEADLSVFPDAAKVQEWAVTPVKWAVAEGLIAGINGSLVPNGNATRAQAARIIMLYTNIEFDDVTPEPQPCEHVWGEWVVTTEPQVGVAGVETATCTLCGATQTRPVDPLPEVPVCEHVWTEWTETVKATHTVDGSETRTCTLCQEVETEVIPKHDADYTIRVFLDPADIEAGAKIDGTDATELLLPICFGEDYNDFIGDFPTATLEGYDFMGWYLESFGFLMNEAEWNGNTYALTSDCEIVAIFEEAAPELPLYDENAWPEALAMGTADYALSDAYQYTVFSFEPTEVGEYTIAANDSLVGIVSYNGMWVSVTPDATTVTESSVVWNCTGVGQAIWVAVKGGAATANITVSVGEPEPEPVINRVEYTNVHTPVAFTFDGDAAALANVAYKDDAVDTAVLGEDGLYHLNAVDGPVLYVNLADSKMNLTDAMGYGQLKHTVTEGNVTTITDYNNAYAAYIACADAATNLYPLTVDLAEVLQKVGATQGWYIEGGWIATTEDAWMFPCYYVPAAVEPEPEAVEFTLVFDVAGDVNELEHGVLVNDAATQYTIKVGDKFSDVVTELPVAEKEGYVFKGWWNRERRVALTPDFDAEKVFDVYLTTDDLGNPETVETIDTTVTLIPIWDTEGEKDWSITFENYDVEGFEPITYGINVGDHYMNIFAGDFPNPGEYWLDEYTQFQGWYIEELNFLLTEGDMWDLGCLALEGHWTLFALYQEV